MPITRTVDPRIKRSPRRPAVRKRNWLKQVVLYLAVGAAAFYLSIAFCMLMLRWIDPPTTAVQIERHLDAWREGSPYVKRYEFVSERGISIHLAHTIIAAEDTRFYQHRGFDWKEMRASVDKALDGSKPRGASTLTQQLVRNLFLSTRPSIFRKALELSLVPLAELILGKRRILELYINVVEWGPGIYGAPAASRYYFRTDAARLTREQALELASLLPAPLHRRPGQVEWYVAQIRTRMRELGW